MPNNIKKRIISGTILIIILLTGILLHDIAFFIIFSIVITLCINEFNKFAENLNIKPNNIISIISALILFATGILYNTNYFDSSILFLNLIIFPLILTAELFRKSENPIPSICYTATSIIYIGLPFFCLSFIVNSNEKGILPIDNFFGGYRWDLLLGIFIILWVNEIFAYLIGSAIGKHKLPFKYSPNKSWEGFISGLISAVLISILIYYIFGNNIPLISWIIIALIISIISPLGDIVESMMKRSVNVKDSSNILPGHGGMLDRFDSFLIVIPIIFLYLFYNNLI